MNGLKVGVKPCLTVILQVKVVLKRTLAVVVVNVEVLNFSGFYTQLLKLGS